MGEISRAQNRGIDFDQSFSFARDRSFTGACERAIDHAVEQRLDFADDLNSNFYEALELDSGRAYTHTSALIRAFDLTLEFAPALPFDHDFAPLGLTWRASLDANLVNEGFWPSLSQAFPLLRLPARSEESWATTVRTIAPTTFEWVTTGGVTPLGQDYDLIFPFSVIAQPEWLKRAPSWATDREWRRLLVLPFLEPHSQLAAQIANALRNPDSEVDEHAGEEERERLSSVQSEARMIARETLHVLLPRPDWWGRPFADWKDADWAVCGYSAQWNMTTGELLWAVGGVDRDAMKMKGLPIESFLTSTEFEMFRVSCPDLFPDSSPSSGGEDHV